MSIEFTNDECDYFLEKLDSMTTDELDHLHLLLKAKITKTIKDRETEANNALLALKNKK